MAHTVEMVASNVTSTMPFSFPRSLEPSLRARHVRLVEDADER